jgi:hypothetical protein
MWSGNIAPPFLTLARDGDDGRFHVPATLPPAERTPGTYWIDKIKYVNKVGVLNNITRRLMLEKIIAT